MDLKSQFINKPTGQILVKLRDPQSTTACLQIERRMIYRLPICLGLLFATFCSCPVSNVLAQGTIADYKRIGTLRQKFRNKVYRTNVSPQWINGEKAMWYRIQTGPGQNEFVVVDIEKSIRSAAFDHEKVANQLTTELKKQVDPYRLPFQKITLDEKLESVFFTTRNSAFKIDRASSKVTKVDQSEIPKVNADSPDVIPASGESVRSINIKIENRRDSEIQLYWMSREGSPTRYESVPAGKSISQHTYAGHVWVATDAQRRPLKVFTAQKKGETFEVTRQSKTTAKFPERARRRGRGRGNRTTSSSFARTSRTSPDRKWKIEVNEFNAYLVSNTNQSDSTSEPTQLTTDGTKDNFYTTSCFWSPDSTRVIVMREQPGFDREIHMVESSPRDQLQPKLITLKYVKPGDKIRVRKPTLFNVASKKQIPVSDSLFENPWRLRDFRWINKGKEITFRYNQRGHQVMRVVGINVEDGTTRSVVEDVAKTFVDYNYKFKVRYLDDSDEIIWASERDGWNHLYLYDQSTGKLKNQITKGDWVFRDFDRVDVEKRQIWFRASGIFPDQDPYYIHYCRIDFSGENLVVLTAGDGTHNISYSPSRKYMIDSYNRVDMAGKIELRTVKDGKLVCDLESADSSRLFKAGWQKPERFVSKGRDGKTDIYGVIYRPLDFDPKKKYPVIEYIYAGPHGSFVPKSFSANPRLQSMAELGFVMVQIDGMGTSNRSKAFHDICWKNLGDSGFPDRILWMKAAAQKYPYMDLSRVGIYGGSAGGQSTLRGLLAHGDFYKVGVSDCGCHDNRMDKIWWNEQWMGWPIGPHYKEQSNVTQAHKLQGKLLLIVGELDSNVDPASTMQVVDALIKADKDFDFLMVPGGGHGVGSAPYGTRRTRDFFVRHLHGVEPRTE